jgi:hypothetical protein
MNILKIIQKTYHEVTVDSPDITMDYSSYYIRLNKIWYNRNEDSSLYVVSNRLSSDLERQFYDMNGVMHEQLELYEDDYSGQQNNNRPLGADTSSGQMWMGAHPDSMRYGTGG